METAYEPAPQKWGVCASCAHGAAMQGYSFTRYVRCRLTGRDNPSWHECDVKAKESEGKR